MPSPAQWAREATRSFLDGALPRDLRWAREVIAARMATQPVVSLAEDFRDAIEAGGEADVPRRATDLSFAFAEMEDEGLVRSRWLVRNPATGRPCVERFDDVEDIAGDAVVHEADGTPFDARTGDLGGEYVWVGEMAMSPFPEAAR